MYKINDLEKIAVKHGFDYALSECYILYCKHFDLKYHKINFIIVENITDSVVFIDRNNCHINKKYCNNKILSLILFLHDLYHIDKQNIINYNEIIDIRGFFW
jgi:hypothetical protein